MAAKEPSSPKAKTPKAVKSGVSKRSPVKSLKKASPKKASPTKASPSKASAPVVDRDLLFLWKCIKISGGLKIDWAAVAKDAGKPAGTVQKQYSRLNTKCEKAEAAASQSDTLNKDVSENVEPSIEANENVEPSIEVNESE